MRLVVLHHGALITDISCEREAIYIGSNGSCAVQLDDPQIAERQLVVYPENNGAWVLEPLDASNEIRLNGTLITSKYPLAPGDEIRVCDFAISTYPEEQAASSGTSTTIMTSVASLTKFAQSQLPYGTLIKKPAEALTLQPQHLTRIGQLNLRLGTCTLPEELMDIALQAALESFAAQRAWIGVRRLGYGPMEYVEGRLLTRQSAELPQHAENYKPRVLDRGQHLLVPKVSDEERTSVLASPLIASDTTLGMLYVDTGDSGRRFEMPDWDFFIAFSNLFAVQLEAIFAQIAKNRAATIDGEVSVAHEIQARVTPRKLPQWETLQFGAFREPGRERTGDVYDIVRLRNQLAGMMVAHTEATGPMPSLLMSQAQAVFRSAAMHLDEPHVYLNMLNWLLYDGQKDHPLNSFMAYIDPATGEVRYAMAGRTGAFIIGQRGDERRLEPAELPPSLSLTKNFQYSRLTEVLEPGETLAVFTPGVTTAKNTKAETFGEERFVNILCDGFGQLASAMLKEMLSDLRSFTEGGSQPDDITVLLAHRV